MSSGLLDVGKIPELRKRLLFTLAMLGVYRLGIFVSTPGINVEQLKQDFRSQSETLFGLVNMFSGGALENFSIFTLGITPYITVSIIIQLLAPSIPALDRLKKEGESGRRVLTKYTRMGTIVLALFQGFMISSGLQAQRYVQTPGLQFLITSAITLAAGTAFIMWLGEQISERGIGNGMSMIIFAGIAARMPSVLVTTLIKARDPEMWTGTLILFLFSFLTVAAIVFVERSSRKIPIQYPRRMVGKRMAQAQMQYMPLKVNMAGVIPPIFASAFLVVPATILSFAPVAVLQDLKDLLTPGTMVYTLVFVTLVVLFSYFYTAVVFNPNEVAENLKKSGGFVPTVRPGQATADFLYGVLNRLTLWGALYIAAVCIVPQWVYIELQAQEFAQVFGGTAVLIVVGVTLDTLSQIESIVLAKNYESFMSKGTKVRGGLGSMAHSRSRLLRK